MSDEFYIGYMPEAPGAIARRVVFLVAIFFVVAGVVGYALVGSQKPFSDAVFEFGIVKDYEGLVLVDPYPSLIVPRAGAEDDAANGDRAGYSRYLLTVFGKFGAEPVVRDYDGQPVAMKGELIRRDGKSMVQIVDGSIQVLEGDRGERIRTSLADAREIPPEDFGEWTLQGEIVDSKCFLGVMKPGNLKPHRSCAARCISGGVPPILLVRDQDGNAETFLLVSRRGDPVNEHVLPLIAEPVEITGAVERRGDLWVLKSDPETYRRIHRR